MVELTIASEPEAANCELWSEGVFWNFEPGAKSPSSLNYDRWIWLNFSQLICSKTALTDTESALEGILRLRLGLIVLN